MGRKRQGQGRQNRLQKCSFTSIAKKVRMFSLRRLFFVQFVNGHTVGLHESASHKILPNTYSSENAMFPILQLVIRS